MAYPSLLQLLPEPLVKRNHPPSTHFFGYPGRISRLGLILCLSAGLLAGVTARAMEAEAKSDEVQPAAPSAEQAAALSPEDQKVFELFEKVGKLFMERRFSEAGEILDEVEKLKPEAQEISMVRAGIFAETGQLGKAREIYAKEVAANPDAFVPNFNLVELLCMEKKYDEAREGFEKLLVKFPENDFLQFKILLTCLAQNKMTEAAVWAQKLQRQVQTPIMIYAAAAISLRSGDLEMGKKLILLAENQFGAGNQFLLYQSLAGINLVLQSDYPPKSDKN